MAKSASPLPAALALAARRFSEWRSRRSGGAIPADLWSLASGLAARHGVSRTARALHLQYYDLKRRVPTTPGSDPVRPAKFVEIVTAAPSVPTEVVVEIEQASGARMRFHLPSVDTAVLGELSRAFLAVRS